MGKGALTKVDDLLWKTNAAMYMIKDLSDANAKMLDGLRVERVTQESLTPAFTLLGIMGDKIAEAKKQLESIDALVA